MKKTEPRILGIDVTTEERERRSANVLRNILAMSTIAGAMPIGLGVPGPFLPEIDAAKEAHFRERLDAIATVKPFLGPFRFPPAPRPRSLAEKKLRRAKRKQRRRR